MARGDIRQRISLDGGEEVRRQLALIGTAGEKALRDLSAATAASSVSLGRFAQLSTSISTAFGATGQALAPVRAAFSDLGTRAASFGNAMRASAGAILPFNTNILAMAAALTAAVAPFALFAQAKKAALATDDLVDTAENLNITTEELIALRQVSEASGAAFDTLEKAMQKGNRTLGEAVASTKGHQVAIEGQVATLRGSTGAFNKAGAAVEIFRGGQEALKEEMQGTIRVMRGSGSLADVTKEYEVIARLAGTTIQGLAKLSPTDRLLAESKALGMVKDETERARLANAAFGKAYADMLPILREADKTLKPTIAQMKEFKQGVSEAEKVMSERFLQALARMNTAMTRLSTFLGGALGAAMVPIFAELERVTVANRTAIEAFATSTSSKLLPVVTDFVTLIGNLGRTMEEQQPLHTNFGKGLVSTFGALKEVVLGVAAAFRTLASAVDLVLVPINKMFGTELTGGVVLATGLVLKFIGAFALLGGIVGLVKGLAIAMGAIAAAVGWPAVLLAGLVALGAGLLIHGDAWKNFTETVNAAWGALKAAGEAIARADFAGLGRGLAEIGKIDFFGLRSTLSALPGLAQQAIEGIKSAFATLGEGLSGVGQIDFLGIRASINALPAALETVKATLAEFTLWVTAQNQAFWDAVIAAGTAVDQNIRQVWGELAGWVSEKLGGALAGIWDKFRSAATSAVGFVTGLFNSLIDLANRVAAAIASAVSSGQSFSGGAPGSFAGGGQVRGPGTGTSDSIPAWLSNREYVTRTRAVDYYGPRFFDLLNRMAIPRDQLLAVLRGGFSRGGLVEGVSRPPAFGGLSRRLQSPFKGFSLGGRVEPQPLVVLPRFGDGGPVAAPAERPLVKLELTIINIAKTGAEAIASAFGGATAPLKAADTTARDTAAPRARALFSKFESVIETSLSRFTTASTSVQAMIAAAPSVFVTSVAAAASSGVTAKRVAARLAKTNAAIPTPNLMAAAAPPAVLGKLQPIIIVIAKTGAAVIASAVREASAPARGIIAPRDDLARVGHLVDARPDASGLRQAPSYLKPLAISAASILPRHDLGLSKPLWGDTFLAMGQALAAPAIVSTKERAPQFRNSAIPQSFSLGHIERQSSPLVVLPPLDISKNRWSAFGRASVPVVPAPLNRRPQPLGNEVMSGGIKAVLPQLRIPGPGMPQLYRNTTEIGPAVLAKTNEAIPIVQTAWQTYFEFQIDAKRPVLALAQALMERQRAAAQTALQWSLSALSSLVAAAATAWASVPVRGAYSGVVTAMDVVLGRGPRGLMGPAIAAGPGPVFDMPRPMARGGYIHGSGTGTSDSVPIWASAGEWISTARAVRFWGPEVFEALNRLQMPKFSLGGIVEGLVRSIVPQQRFAAGGLVAAPAGGIGAPQMFAALNCLEMPRCSLGGLVEGFSRPLVPRQRFAGGGRVAARSGGMGSPLHLHLGGQTFVAQTDALTLEGLGQAIRRSKLLSAGRGPGWRGT